MYSEYNNLPVVINNIDDNNLLNENILKSYKIPWVRCKTADYGEWRMQFCGLR